MNTEQDKGGELRKTKEEEFFAPLPPPSKSFSFISGHPLATSSPIKWNRMIKKEPNLDSTIGEDDGRMRNSMTTSMATMNGDDESMSEVDKKGVKLGLIVKKEEPFIPSESPSRHEESGVLEDVKAICKTPPRSSPTPSQSFMTTPVTRKAVSEERDTVGEI